MLKTNKKKGFTLVEVLITCLIIGIILTASIPTFKEMLENIKTETLSEELYNDLNSSKIAAVSIGQDYEFIFVSDGWEIESGGDKRKKKEIIDSTLYIEQNVDTLVFKPLGFTRDKDGNTITLSSFKVCNSVTKNGYTIKINGFGKTNMKEEICS